MSDDDITQATTQVAFDRLVIRVFLALSRGSEQELTPVARRTLDELREQLLNNPAWIAGILDL